jgi:hypothetical protein
MRWFVAALLRQSTLLVSRRGDSGEKEKEIYVKEFLTDAHIACIMSQDLKAIYRLLKYLLSSPLALPSPPHSLRFLHATIATLLPPYDALTPSSFRGTVCLQN